MESIGNVFCVGRNYQAHIEELNNQRPKEPVWFMKPSHSVVVCGQDQRIILPKDQGEIHYEVELVIQMKADYLPNQPLETLVGTVALGLDLTLRDLQSQLKAKGLPWLRSKGFKNSAVLTEGVPYSSLGDFGETNFQLRINDQIVQRGNTQLMIFNLEELLANCWEQFDLKAGDIIFTGTPAGVGGLTDGDKISMYLNDGCLGECVISLK
ncbi:fumarylacetoacetate hydrolase family protein [uncultured Vagococcus sp.]|uniref:fumarylacetoacetate hydrolase family protein n=1 Tax=uncultured Vagococcus sp. TaxID=189676 RepID=UPI0028D434C9|nr:fumarylacetoacetate hydrolase family protein [uncultured Vagococcus sp.]